MSPVAILLIVTAAFAHAGWNLFAKRAGSSGVTFVWLYASMSTALLVPIAVVEVLVSGRPPAWDWVIALFVSGLLHVSYFVLLQRGYATGDLSVVYPLARGTGPLLSVLLAVTVLGERPRPLALVGAAVVVAGVFVIGTARTDRPGERTGNRRGGVLYGLLTGATIAAYTLWDARAVTTLGVPPIVQNAGSALVEALALTPYALRHRDRLAPLWQRHRLDAAVIAVLSPLAYVLVLYALRIAPIALVAPARELSIVIGGLVAWLLLGEPRPLRRLTGAVIVLAGVTALAIW